MAKEYAVKHIGYERKVIYSDASIAKGKATAEDDGFGGGVGEGYSSVG